MTESVDISEIIIGYDKFLAMRARQKVANQKYRSTDYGKKKTNEMHKIWCDKRKDDLEYKKHLNLKARERYQIRKAKKLEEKEICLGESEKVDSLGESEI